MSDQFEIHWVDSGREPQCASDRLYPEGIDLDCTSAGQASCTASLPYPAKRCGYYFVSCRRCGTTAGITTAGRADDPRSVKLGCALNVPPGEGKTKTQ
jgi:hypothetical protein